MGEIIQPTPEKRKQRSLTEAELLTHGAEYDESGNLQLTKEQMNELHGEAKEEMEKELLSKSLVKYLSTKELADLCLGLEELSKQEGIEKEKYEQLKKLGEKIDFAFQLSRQNPD